MEPNGTRSFLLGDYFNFTCHANHSCYNKLSVYENGTEDDIFGEWCSHETRHLDLFGTKLLW